MGETPAPIMNLYQNENLLARFHVGVRYRRALLGELLGYVPESGYFLDVGCGHGVFANLLALDSSKREITGIDIAENKIAIALRTVGSRKNINFLSADATEFIPQKRFNVISVIDTLYLIPFDLQQKLLAALSKHLEADGLLLISEFCRDNSLRFRRVLLQETISVKLIKITFGNKFYFRSVLDWQELLEKLGFSVQVVKRKTPNPTHLFLCRRKLL